jgi:hypothetical protein
MHTSYGADLFRVYMNMGNASWTALRTKFARAIVAAHLHRRDGSSTSGNKHSAAAPPVFLYVFGGSSVTAGHDNYYNQSYPSVFDRRMRPVFDALGIDLRVRNIAMGATGCDPYNACYGPHADNDPDFVSWCVAACLCACIHDLLLISSIVMSLLLCLITSHADSCSRPCEHREQSYFCKRSPSMEYLARYAASSASHAVMMFQASGSSIPRTCNASAPDTVPYNSEEWSPSSSSVHPPLKPWAASPEDLRRERDALFEYNAALPTGAK